MEGIKSRSPGKSRRKVRTAINPDDDEEELSPRGKLSMS